MSFFTCPPGFDCAYLNSCPSPYIDCPPGYFCGSYEGLPGQSDMDYSFAIYKTQFGGFDGEVTRKNAKILIDPDRSIQNACLTGFYCPDATSMEICPEGHWCPERTVVPQKCDDLSICGEQAYYQVNFINPIVMAVLVFVFLFASIYLTSSQARAKEASSKKDPTAKTITPNGDKEMVPTSEEEEGLFEVSFQNIQCVIPGTNAVILPEISGKVPAGKITALMGPTASGKSTLTNVLRHGQLPISTSGIVSYQIRSSSSTTADRVKTLTAEEAQPFIGHVPQEDILDRQLTIRELFTFHAKARTRHHRLLTEEEIRQRVDEVLADLSIQHVADSIIGGNENMAANISGGQLKRVNIGCELVALSKPGLLLLDEPTAGLDAAIAYELMQTLESLKARGITIFMVIQQPRAEIFERIDHLLLMNSVGGIIYEGQSAQAVPYLLSLGYTPNPEAFDADYCLDVLNGLRDPSSSASQKLDSFRLTDSNNNKSQNNNNNMDIHAQHVSETRDNSFNYKALTADDNAENIALSIMPNKRQHNNQPEQATLDCTKLHIVWKQLAANHADIENHHQQTSSSLKLDGHDLSSVKVVMSVNFWQRWFYHCYLNAERLIVVRLRNRTSLLVYMFIDFIMALALSSGFTIFLNSTYRGVFVPPVDQLLQGFYPSSLQRYATNNAASMGFAQLMFFMSSALGSSSALSAVPVFSGATVIATREHAAGISVASFAVGRILGDVIFVILHGFVFAGVWMLFGHAGHYYDWLAVILSTSFAASGIGYITSASYKQSTASTWAIVAAFVSSVFAGVEPSLAQVSKYPVVSWPWYCNFATWTAEATYFTYTRYLLDDGHVPVPLQDGADMYGYKIAGKNGIARSVGAMIALGVSMRIVAAIMLYRRVTSVNTNK